VATVATANGEPFGIELRGKIPTAVTKKKPLYRKAA